MKTDHELFACRLDQMTEEEVDHLSKGLELSFACCLETHSRGGFLKYVPTQNRIGLGGSVTGQDIWNMAQAIFETAERLNVGIV